MENIFQFFKEKIDQVLSKQAAGILSKYKTPERKIQDEKEQKQQKPKQKKPKKQEYTWEQEKKLKQYATEGVIQLFTELNKHQKDFKEKQETEAQKERKERFKRKMRDLKKQKKSKSITPYNKKRKLNDETVKKPKWDMLTETY